METVHLVVKVNHRGEREVLHVCRTKPGAISKIRKRIDGDPLWISRFEDTLWNKGEECIKVMECGVED